MYFMVWFSVGGFVGDKLAVSGHGGGWITCGPLKCSSKRERVVLFVVPVSGNGVPDSAGGGVADFVGGGHGLESFGVIFKGGDQSIEIFIWS